MKKSFKSFIAAFVAINAFSLAYAGPFDFMNQDKKEETKSDNKQVDLNKLSASGQILVIRVSQATQAFSASTMIMLTALNLKKEAEQMKVLQEELKKAPEDQEKIKKLLVANNEAMAEINKAKINEKSKLAVSNKELLNAFIYCGAGALTDAKAVNDAANLIKECELVINYVKADPIKYGLGALPTINSVISSSKFIADNVPEQIKSVKGFSDTLGKVIKTKKLALPTPKEIQKEVESMTKG